MLGLRHVAEVDMKVKWMGIFAVLVIGMGIVFVKTRPSSQNNSSFESSSPQVVLVATPAEAASRTRCGDIVRLVRAASQRGVKVKELTPDSSSDLLARYKVLRTPTVLFLAQDGQLRARFEGESPETLAALQSEMQRTTP
jgi:hypothetical protein